jgi:hypothetical protein
MKAFHAGSFAFLALVSLGFGQDGSLHMVTCSHPSHGKGGWVVRGYSWDSAQKAKNNHIAEFKGHMPLILPQPRQE